MLRPRISVNVALSADGKITSVDQRPANWTSAADKRRLRDLRQGSDALLAGRGTWQTDAMKMRLHQTPDARQPLRCVVSRSGHFDPQHPMFCTAGGPIHLLVTGANGPLEENFGPVPVVVHHASLTAFLEIVAAEHAVRHLHCEGGGQLIRELAELDLIDDLHLTFCGHTLFGGSAAPTATGLPGEAFSATRKFKLAHFEPQPELGECFLSYTRDR